MKQYKVKTHLLDRYSKGEEIPKSTMNDLLDVGCPESWFEPIEEEFSVGDWVYWQASESEVYGPIRIEEIDNERVWHTGNDYNRWRDQDDKDWLHIGNIDRKATPNEIEQALIKEAKRRGYKNGIKIKTIEREGVVKLHSGIFSKYHEQSDFLLFDARVIYKQGKWAEILDEPITINGHEVEVESVSAKVGCTSIDGIIFTNLNNYADEFELTIMREGEDITEQIKQIAQRL